MTVGEQVAHAVAQPDAHKRQRELVFASLVACPQTSTASERDERHDRQT